MVYYAGHGLIDFDGAGELYLALPGSDRHRMDRALRYEYLRRILSATKGHVKQRVVLLDCCYAERAFSAGMSPQPQLTHAADLDTSCVLAASGATAMALAPVGGRYTAFTGELIGLLETGLPGGPPYLDIQTLAGELERVLRSKSLPVPKLGSFNRGDRTILAINRAYTRPAPRSEEWEVTSAESEHALAAMNALRWERQRFAIREWSRRQNRFVAVGYAAFATALFVASSSLFAVVGDLARVQLDTIANSWAALAVSALVIFLVESALAWKLGGYYHPQWSMLGGTILLVAQKRSTAWQQALFTAPAICFCALACIFPAAVSISTGLGTIIWSVGRYRHYRQSELAISRIIEGDGRFSELENE